jgi:hypothetical protein
MKRLLTEDSREKYESEIGVIRDFWYSKAGRYLEEHLRLVAPKVATERGVEMAALQGASLGGALKVLDEIERVANLNNPEYHNQRSLQLENKPLKEFQPEVPKAPWEDRVEKKRQKEKNNDG